MTEAGATLPKAPLPYHFPLWNTPPTGSSVCDRLSSSPLEGLRWPTIILVSWEYGLGVSGEDS